MTERALLLTPSRGLGGGIERYVATLEWVMRSRGLSYRRMDLKGSGPRAHAQLLFGARDFLRADSSRTRLILAHRTLLPLGMILLRQGCVEGISVVLHGSEVWGRRHGLRRLFESRAMRHTDVRPIAVSNYTSGALSHLCNATVVPPGLSDDWYQELVAARRRHYNGSRREIVTAFRLSAWREKGLLEIIQAVAMLRRPGLELVVCGSGEAPAELEELLSRYSFCRLRAALSDSELAMQLASAKVFVLATRTRRGRRGCGEGYGMVLQEAQLAGSPVVGPAYGGSHEAFIEGVTGLAPADERAATLANVLENLLDDTKRLDEMAKDAAEWAYEMFAPARYSDLVLSRLL